ncbi:MAG: Heme exporter protein C [Alphaproteobacteria bacterium MarineAlpha2_Bin1]|nr:MAG: Heme exporter protein C [Alphaproteobacteria bacterium MarineAlpha2_Bin1]
MKKLHKLANPGKFYRLSEKILPWSNLLAISLCGLGLYLGLFVAPPDYQQGETVRIIYVHVPAATLASLVYAIMAITSAISFIWKNPLGSFIAKAAAPIGAAFTIIAIITGALWGKPTWGTWWIWDARLTSVLILFFLYLGYIGVWQIFEDQNKAAKAAAIIALVGAINLPIIKFSVDWWNTLHQGASIIRLDGPSIHSDILIPLIFMWLGFISYLISVLIIRIQSEITLQKIRAIQIMISEQK